MGIYKTLETTKTKLGNKIELLGCSSEKGQVLIVGVVHGDEPQGEELITRYISEETKENVLFIPCLNPDGKQLGERTNSNGVDINRNFPTKNWELGERDKYFGGTSPSSEIETKFLVKVLEDYNPILILTLHTPYKVVNYDGPAKEVAELISKIMNYPVEESIGYPTPGSFGTYAGIEKNLPVITLELDEEISVEALYPNVKEVFNQVIR
jgi:protein MpaA